MSGAYRDRLFRPGDVRRILRRAAELQDEAKSEGAGGRPQTLEELTRIATEAGISEVALTRALGEDGGGASAPKKVSSWSWAGGPTRVVIERTIPQQISSQAHMKLVKAMRRATGEPGNPQAFGDSLSWATVVRPNGRGRQLSAIVEPGDEGGTLLRIDENLSPLRGRTFGLVLGLVGGVGLPIIAGFTKELLGRDVVPAALLICALVAYLLARTLYGSRAHAREAQLRAMADTLVAELSAGAALSYSGTGSSASTSGENVRVAAPILTPPIEGMVDDEPSIDELQRNRSATR